jgi:predicted KAP-like P-loop ATPase
LSKNLQVLLSGVRTFIKLNYKTINGEQLLLKPQDFSSCT